MFLSLLFLVRRHRQKIFLKNEEIRKNKDVCSGMKKWGDP